MASLGHASVVQRPAARSCPRPRMQVNAQLSGAAEAQRMKRDEQSRNHLKMQDLQRQVRRCGQQRGGRPDWQHGGRAGRRCAIAWHVAGAGCRAVPAGGPALPVCRRCAGLRWARRAVQPAACRHRQAQLGTAFAHSAHPLCGPLLQLGSHLVTPEMLNDTRESEQRLAAALAAKQEQLATSRWAGARQCQLVFASRSCYIPKFFQLLARLAVAGAHLQRLLRAAMVRANAQPPAGVPPRGPRSAALSSAPWLPF